MLRCFERLLFCIDGSAGLNFNIGSSSEVLHIDYQLVLQVQEYRGIS